jgi:sortase A
MAKKHSTKAPSSVNTPKKEWFAPVFGIGTAAAILALFNLQLFITSISIWITPSIANAAGPVISNANDEKYSKTPRIVIPKINVDVPVVYGMTSVVEANVQEALKKGVVHFADTSKPGFNGNAVFVGHSSNSVWEEGDYKFVFALLDKLDKGDSLYLFYEGKRYTYIVTAEKIVNARDVSVLNPTQKPTITLVTCYPVGTAFSRLVITAEQVDPDPATAQDSAQPNGINQIQLPGN